MPDIEKNGSLLTPEEKETLLEAWADGRITTDEMAKMREAILEARRTAPAGQC